MPLSHVLEQIFDDAARIWDEEKFDDGGETHIYAAWNQALRTYINPQKKDAEDMSDAEIASCDQRAIAILHGISAAGATFRSYRLRQAEGRTVFEFIQTALIHRYPSPFIEEVRSRIENYKQKVEARRVGGSAYAAADS